MLLLDCWRRSAWKTFHENISYPPQYLSILILLTASCLFTHYRQMHPANNFRVLSHPGRVLLSQRCFMNQHLASSQGEETPQQMSWHERKNCLAWDLFSFFLFTNKIGKKSIYCIYLNSVNSVQWEEFKCNLKGLSQ